MFSDFKSRGFGLEQTHIQYPDRLARLILVMSLALYWAVSTGMWDHLNNPTPVEKKTRASARQARPKQALLVHAWDPPRHQAPPPMSPSPEPLGMLAKLMDAQHLEQGRQKKNAPIPILNIGSGDEAIQEQALRVNEDMPLLALDLLARVEPRRVDTGPPFSALLTLWLSITQAVGLASRLSLSKGRLLAALHVQDMMNTVECSVPFP